MHEALEQTESALLARQTTAAERAARRTAAAASVAAWEQARTRYAQGQSAFGDLLEAQRTMLANRIELTRSQAAAAHAAIATFEAIGVISGTGPS